MPNYTVSGFDGCRWFNAANELQAKLTKQHPEVKVNVNKLPDREAYHSYRKTILAKLGKDEDSHTTSPLVFVTDEDLNPQGYIGGYDAFSTYVKKTYNVEKD